VLLSQRRHERGVDMVAVEYEQTKDRMLRKYDMWDDQQASPFLSFFLLSIILGLFLIDFLFASLL